ncbi:unnamed protein product [Cuscuta europaea]|uniref:Uncharacterized protein n=1 Tax=Cuscuta europaea TaxID=41803 RepID=A0A9P0YSE6_CUSEU|nr:unnamed protein product [Cuscuta europaea]
MERRFNSHPSHAQRSSSPGFNRDQDSDYQYDGIPKTSEYTYFKKVKESLGKHDHQFRNKESQQELKDIGSCYANGIGKLKEKMKTPNTNDYIGEALRKSTLNCHVGHTKMSAQPEKVILNNRCMSVLPGEERCKSPVEECPAGLKYPRISHHKTIEVLDKDLYLSPPRSALSKHSGSQYLESQIFSVKRQKLCRWAEMTLAGSRNSSSQGYDMLAVLLSRLCPNRNENKGSTAIDDTGCSTVLTELNLSEMRHDDHSHIRESTTPEGESFQCRKLSRQWGGTRSVMHWSALPSCNSEFNKLEYEPFQCRELSILSGGTRGILDWSSELTTSEHESPRSTELSRWSGGTRDKIGWSAFPSYDSELTTSAYESSQCRELSRFGCTERDAMGWSSFASHNSELTTAEYESYESRELSRWSSGLSDIMDWSDFGPYNSSTKCKARLVQHSEAVDNNYASYSVTPKSWLRPIDSPVHLKQERYRYSDWYHHEKQDSFCLQDESSRIVPETLLLDWDFDKEKDEPELGIITASSCVNELHSQIVTPTKHSLHVHASPFPPTALPGEELSSAHFYSLYNDDCGNAISYFVNDPQSTPFKVFSEKRHLDCSFLFPVVLNISEGDILTSFPLPGHSTLYSGRSAYSIQSHKAWNLGSSNPIQINFQEVSDSHEEHIFDRMIGGPLLLKDSSGARSDEKPFIGHNDEWEM